MSLIHLDAVSKIYLLGTQEIYALKSIQLQIEFHEFVSIVGRSGSGKSSMMNLVAGLDHPTLGKIWVEGQDLATLTRKEIANYRASQIGMVFQSFHLVSHNTAFQNVELPLIFQGISPSKRQEQVKMVLERVGLKDRMDHRPSQLSGGERQRVAIARALVSHPKIILADEPTGNLDSQTSKEILELFLKIYQEEHATILFITHDLELANTLSTRTIELRDGEIVKNTYLNQSKTI
ncbi:MAG: ABC transporter ATP-binding protein [Planctomycetota bacterium]